MVEVFYRVSVRISDVPIIRLLEKLEISFRPTGSKKDGPDFERHCAEQIRECLGEEQYVVLTSIYVKSDDLIEVKGPQKSELDLLILNRSTGEVAAVVECKLQGTLMIKSLSRGHLIHEQVYHLYQEGNVTRMKRFPSPREMRMKDMRTVRVPSDVSYIGIVSTDLTEAMRSFRYTISSQRASWTDMNRSHPTIEKALPENCCVLCVESTGIDIISRDSIIAVHNEAFSPDDYTRIISKQLKELRIKNIKKDLEIQALQQELKIARQAALEAGST